MGVDSLIMLVIWILVLALVVYALNFLLAQLALPQPIKTIILVIVAIVVLLIVLQRFGLVYTPDLLPMAGNPQSGGSG